MSNNRIAPLGREELEPLESEFERAEGVLGFVPNSLLIMGRRPDMVRAFGQLSTAVFMGSDLDVELKDMIAHVASAAAGCAYCQAHTAAKLSRKDVVPEKISRVWEFEESDLFSSAEKAALRLARDASIVPNAVTHDHFDELKMYYSDEQIVDIVGIVSLFGFLNRWNDTFATPLEDEPAGVGEELLSDRGWQAGKHQAGHVKDE